MIRYQYIAMVQGVWFHIPILLDISPDELKWEQPHTLQYFLAADQAAFQMMSDGGFNCHTQDYKDAKKECAGFKMAKLVFEK